jgi:SAM-dependent methyltransferase
MNIPSNFLYSVFSKLAGIFKPPRRILVKVPDGFYSPHLQFCIKEDIVKKHISDYKMSHSGNLSFIDVGGRYGAHEDFAKGFDYKVLEIDETVNADHVIIGDICHCPQIPDNTFDVCFSNYVFEHLKQPWLAAEECIRITKKGGLLIHLLPFSWRYHPVPVDFYRYTHDGIAYLFEKNGSVERIISAYDISLRRKDHRGGKIDKGLDVPPVDELGGWREHWTTVYVARKL